MTDLVSKTKPRRLKIILLLLSSAVILAIVTVAGRIYFYRHNQKEIIAAIEAEGGKAYLCSSTVSSDNTVADFIQNTSSKLYPEIGYAMFVSEESMKHLADLPKLSVLKLSGEKITDTAMLLLQKTPEIDTLILDNTSITELNIDKVDNLKRLWKLSIKSPVLSPRMIDALAKINPPQHLAIFTSRVSEDILSRLQTVPVTELIIEDSIASDSFLKSLEGNSKIIELRLIRCSLTDEGLKPINHLPNLGSLDISGNDISDAGLKNLDEINPVFFLFSDTKITPEGWAEFRKDHPNTINGWRRGE
jgi:Leucine-rich repeat (LRR) protein